MAFSPCLFLSSSILKDATGIAGNIFAFGLFLSPIPTFRRIMRNRSTEHFSGLPYIYALLNCLICLWYGSPLVSSDNILVFTVNSVGAVFQLTYSVIFMVHVDKARKVKMLVMLLLVFALWAVIVFGSLQISNHSIRRDLVGLLSCASLISMFASPLFIINLVIRTKSVEYMPFYLSLSTLLMSISFFAYGIFNDDAFVFVPNGMGTVLGILQLALYSYYRKRSSVADDSLEPLIISYSRFFQVGIRRRGLLFSLYTSPTPHSALENHQNLPSVNFLFPELVVHKTLSTVHPIIIALRQL